MAYELPGKEQERKQALYVQVERIRRKLEEKGMSKNAATRTSGEIYTRALKLDEIIAEIRADPNLDGAYEFEGEVLKFKGTGAEVCSGEVCSGEEMMKLAADQYIDAFIKDARYDPAETILLNLVDDHISSARKALASWEGAKRIVGLAKGDAYRSTNVGASSGKRNPRPRHDRSPVTALGPEEKSFFGEPHGAGKSYEEQMDEFVERTNKK